MQRRDFLKMIAGSAAAWSHAAHAQQGERIRRIGILMPIAQSDHEGQARLASLRSVLERLGWSEGRNVQYEIRWTDGRSDLFPSMAKELIESKPDLLVANATPSTAALLK